MGKRTVHDGRHKIVDNVRYRPSHLGPVHVLLKSLCPTRGEQTSVVALRPYLRYRTVRYGTVPYGTVEYGACLAYRTSVSVRDFFCGVKRAHIIDVRT